MTRGRALTLATDLACVKEGHGENRYYFWLVALDSDLNLPAGLTLWQFLEKEEPHIKGTNRLVGTYTPK